jgi:hypothetical protein
MKSMRFFSTCVVVGLVVSSEVSLRAEDPVDLPKASIDGNGPGWVELGEKDFVTVNGDPDTWVWKDGVAHCKGTPVGVARTQKQYTNFELVCQWRHLKSGGNSGVFAWCPESALADLPPGKLPGAGIEVQVLDIGFKENFEKNNPDRKADWFTTHGDVFAVGASKFNPFPPTSPNGSRSFPRKELSKRSPEWNHYYVRGVNGEIRLWVNGEEVAGGAECTPSSGYLCLESEGAPVEFKNIRIRELPATQQ